MTKSITMLAVVALAMHAAKPRARADSLDAVLSRMDKAAKEFKSVTADLKQTEYTAVVKDSTQDVGALRIKRDKKGLSALIEYKPDPRTTFFKDKKVSYYYPKANQVQEIDLGKYTTLVDQFLLLAFGTSGEELRRNYDVKLGGAATLGSTATTRLDLLPKAPDAKKFITKIELWIKNGESYAIQEKVTETSGNYTLGEYSNVKWNPALPDSAFDWKPPKGVMITHPQH